MHRRGGEDDDLLVAISPPPEFQDLPAPPPTVFRDLSPLSPSSKSEAHHQRLCDFAARISFNIVNEAMVIATEEVVSLHNVGDCNVNVNVSYPSTTVSTQDAHHASDSSEEETSITTSWEYLPKSSSKSSGKTPLRGGRLGVRPGDGRSSSPIKVNRSASFHLELGGGGCCTTSTSSGAKSGNILHQCHNNSRSHVGPKPSSNRHSIAETSNIMLNEKHRIGYSRDDTQGDLGDNEKKDDIYSLPVDDISTRLVPCSEGTRNKGSGTSRSRPNSISNLQNCDDETKRVIEALDSVKISVCLEDHEETKESVAERKDYLSSNCDGNSGGNKRNQTARRSQSVEVNISNVVDSSTYHLDTSRLNYNDRSQCTSTKQEKRTIGHSILNLFKRKSRSKARLNESESYGSGSTSASRALPPPPPPPAAVVASDSESEMEPMVRISDNQENSFSGHMDLGPWSDDESLDDAPIAKDFTVSIEKVKDCGWYWGPLSSEAAEDLLRGEPDGSFIVRDSSDAHYIFSLTFKLNGLVRHVRIEHDQGNFSFGPLTRFKAATIVDFVEKAVAHSRSGRYLFFLHRRPILGPMRVQLLHPYSRFRHPRSLQHMCRFVILKYVRRDLISSLPLPTPLQEYLNTPHYYFEKYEDRKSC